MFKDGRIRSPLSRGDRSGADGQPRGIEFAHTWGLGPSTSGSPWAAPDCMVLTTWCLVSFVTTVTKGPTSTTAGDLGLLGSEVPVHRRRLPSWGPGEAGRHGGGVWEGSSSHGDQGAEPPLSRCRQRPQATAPGPPPHHTPAAPGATR